METIRIKYFSDKIEKLTYIENKSDWIDLRAAKDVSLKKGEFALIPLGVAMELPEGYELAYEVTLMVNSERQQEAETEAEAE